MAKMILLPFAALMLVVAIGLSEWVPTTRAQNLFPEFGNVKEETNELANEPANEPSNKPTNETTTTEEWKIIDMDKVMDFLSNGSEERNEWLQKYSQFTEEYPAYGVALVLAFLASFIMVVMLLTCCLGSLCCCWY